MQSVNFQYFRRLNVLGICQSYDATIDLIDSMAKHYNHDVIQLKHKIERHYGIEVSILNSWTSRLKLTMT